MASAPAPAPRATEPPGEGLVGLLEAGAQDWIDYRDCGIERATNVLLAMLWEGLAGLRERGILAAS
mgnify:CR=1 FL=1